MDSLRPERDELDQFKKRSAKAPKTPKTPARGPAGSAEVSVKQAASPLRSVVMLLLVLASGGLSWASYHQQQEVAALQKQLDDALSFIGQSKLLIARLEGELNITGEELAENGTAVEKKLAFLDSEMRKLWGVTNDRNKKAIRDNTEALDAMRGKIAAYEKQLKAANDGYQLKLSELNTKVVRLERSQSGVESRISVVASESAITREAINDELAGLKKALARLDKQEKLISENQKAISSIDASRRQLNERVIDLERKLNEMQLGRKPGSVDVQ